MGEGGLWFGFELPVVTCVLIKLRGLEAQFYITSDVHHLRFIGLEYVWEVG